MLRKAVGTVQASSAMTLKERHCANTLLRNALKHDGLDELRDKRQHSILMADLCEEVYGSRRNREKILKTLEGLRTKHVTWQYTTEKSKRTLGASSWLAGWELRDGVLRYSYSAELVDHILGPRIWARLNFSIQRIINRSHSQALYENCARYRDMGRTAYWTLDAFRGLMGVGEHKSYKNFKILNRDVIKPAVAEINEKTEIWVEPILKYCGKRCVGLHFEIADNDSYEGPDIPMVLPLSESLDTEMLEERARVYEQLLEFGIDHGRAVQILESYPDRYILDNLSIVARRIRTSSKPIRNVAGYTVKALANDYRPARDESEIQQGLQLETEDERQQKERERLRTAAADELTQFQKEAVPRWRVSEWERQQTEETLAEAWSQFRCELATTNAYMGRIIQKNPDSPWIQSLWRNWVRTHCLDPISDDILLDAAKALSFDLAAVRKRAGE